MKLPRVRFTVRRMMVAVAVMAVLVEWVTGIRQSRLRDHVELMGKISDRFMTFEQYQLQYATQNEQMAAKMRAEGNYLEANIWDNAGRLARGDAALVRTFAENYRWASFHPHEPLPETPPVPARLQPIIDVALMR